MSSHETMSYKHGAISGLKGVERANQRHDRFRDTTYSPLFFLLTVPAKGDKANPT